MRTKKGYVLRPLGVEYILVAEGLEAADANKIISMNETAAFLYRKAQGIEFTPETLAGFLTEEYEVAEETALKDAKVLCQQWIDAGIAE